MSAPLAWFEAPPACFHAVAGAVVASIALGAMAGRRSTRAAALLGGGGAAAAIAVASGRADAAGVVAAVAAAAGLAATGLAALGAALGAPRVAAGVVAALALGVACGGVWWADRVAPAVAPERRGALREAVVGADPLTAVAFAVGYDRLHAPDVYDETTIGSTTVRAPDAATTAAVWGALGAVALAGAAIVARRDARRRPASAVAAT